MKFRAIPSISDINVTRVRLDSGGYDSTGAYWGVGAPLWHCSATITGGIAGDIVRTDTVRAPNARAALHKFLPVYAKWETENGN